MKRAPTLDKHGRQTAEQNAVAAKASISKEENNVTADNKTSGTTPFKKLRLSARKDGTSVKNISQSEETEQRPTSPVSSAPRDTANAEQTTESNVAAMRSPNASVPVLRNASSKLATTTGAALAVPASPDTRVQASSAPRQENLLSPEPANANRRQQWLEQEKPSFIFAEITDPSLLALFDTALPAVAPVATGPQSSDREQKRQLQPIAHAIRKALESILADVTRKFMTTGKQDGVPKPEFQKAHHAFSELMQMFNRAKVAAVDEQEAIMVAELKSICPALEQFIARGLKDAIQHFSAEKSEREALKTALRSLLVQCREWLGEDKEEAVRPWSPSFAPSSPQGRHRSVSSPVKANEPWIPTESGNMSRLSASFAGPLSSHSSQHRIGPFIPGSTATLSPTSTPSGSPLTSPVQSPKTIFSPKDGTSSFRLSTRIGSPGSPRAKDASRKDSSVKGQSRQSMSNESTSHSSLVVQPRDKPDTPEKAKTEKSKKKLQ